jgi:hypothetical protein
MVSLVLYVCFVDRCLVLYVCFVDRCLVLYVCFVDRCLSFCTFYSGIVLSVLLRYTDYCYPFGIFKIFLI